MSRYLSLVVLFFLITPTHAAVRQPYVLSRSSLPIPPRQYAPSQSVQTSLSKTFSSATDKLFEQGLADPRGCEYRQVEIVVHSIWGGSETTLNTHAWVLPQSGNGGQRFVVAWNGLVYPALSVGECANLKEDVLAAIEADETARIKGTYPTFGRYRFRLASPEGFAVSHKSLLPLKACLLLRLGENILAEQVWAIWSSGLDPKLNSIDALHQLDPYLLFAADWLWARFERSVCAHMRHDDRLALDDARFLNSIRSTLAETIAERSSFWPTTYQANSYVKTSFVSFLETVPLLLADQERRLNEGPIREPSQTKPTGHVDKAELVATLVSQLDEATAYQRAQPGGVDMSEDFTVQQLIKQGDAAVEPLLGVLENDNRLTRSVSFGRDFAYQRHIIPVFEVAYRALAIILKISQKESIPDWEELRKPGTEGRRVVASRLRAGWTKEK